MKMKKLKIVQNKMGLKGCKWYSLNAPCTDTHLSGPYWKLEEFPFLSGVIRMGSQYESEEVAKFGEQDWFKGLQIIQF